MLQQTQVSRVIGYYERFLKRFPNIFELAKTNWEEFLPYYSGLGYYKRGRNMLKTAQVVVQDFGGEFPGDFDALVSLPGVGEYTANAILAFGFRKNVLAWDTNMRRVFGRFFYGSKKNVIQNSRFSFESEPEGSSLRVEDKIQDCDLGELSAATMDFANLVCLNKPLCSTCTLRKKCTYFATGGTLEASPRSTRSAFPTREARVHLWLHKDHKEYYSPNPDTLECFTLPAGVNTRDQIKKYFLKKYSLTLSVRPPHKKTFVRKKPVLFVNAQILLGEHEFGVFEKTAIMKDL